MPGPFVWLEVAETERWQALLDEPEFFRTAGAGAIGRRTAAALLACARSWSGGSAADLRAALAVAGEAARRLKPSMATVAHAVAAATEEVHRLAAAGAGEGLRTGISAFLERYIRDSETACERIGENGAALVPHEGTVLVHSSSEAVRAVLLRAARAGRRCRVIATASLPLGEGRAMAAALAAGGVPVTLIPDAAAGPYLKTASLVLVGADAILPDGAVVNKAGTLMLALAARTAGVPFYVAAESMKGWPGGKLRLETGEPDEVWANPPAGVGVANPLFEATPAGLITGVITESGVTAPAQAGAPMGR